MIASFIYIFFYSSAINRHICTDGFLISKRALINRMFYEK